jgi:hypothetical protein
MVASRDGTEGEACIHGPQDHDSNPSTMPRYRTDRQSPCEAEVLQDPCSFPLVKQGLYNVGLYEGQVSENRGQRRGVSRELRTPL